MARLPVLFLAAIVSVAVLGPVLSPYGGMEQERFNPLAPPSAKHWLGTDNFGRDELTRLLIATRVSLLAGCLATSLTLGIGAILGCLAGFYGGLRDTAIVQVSELFLSLPWFYLFLGIRSLLPLTLRPSAVVLMIGLVGGLTAWPRTCRLVRGVVVSERERDYVAAARSFGASNFYLQRHHIFPACRGVVLVQAALLVPQFILAEATLSFFGLGVGEPGASLGNMLIALRDPNQVSASPWMLAPAVMLIVIAACCRSLSDSVH